MPSDAPDPLDPPRRSAQQPITKGTGNTHPLAPNYVGGGGVFTPKPRSYEYALPKKAVAGALRSALSLRAKEAKLVVLDHFNLDSIKTARVKKALVVLGSA